MKRLFILLALLALPVLAVDTFIRVVDGKFVMTDGVIQTGDEPVSLWTDTNSPTAAWYLQGTQPSNVIEDASGNGFDMAGAGIHPVVFSGDRNEGLYYRSNASHIEESDAPNFIGDGVSNLSFSAWIYPELSPGAGDGIMNIGDFSSSQGEAAFLNQSDDLLLRINGQTVEGSGALRASNVIQLNEWQLVGWTYDGLSLVIYTNGAVAASNTYSSILDCAGLKSVIGGAFSSAYEFEGFITKERFYKRTLSPTDMADIFAGGRTNDSLDLISTTDVVYYYPHTNLYVQALDSVGGRSSLDPELTFVNAPTFRIPEGTNDNGVYYSVSFDGTDDYLQVGMQNHNTETHNRMNPRTADFTLITWVKFDGLDRYDAISGRKHLEGGGDSGYGFFTGTDASINEYILAECRSVAGRSIVTSDVQVVSNVWYCVGMTRTDGSLNLYINGVKQASTNVANQDIDCATTSEFVLGSRDNGGLPMTGNIMESRWYLSNGLPASVMLEIYQNTGTNNNENRITWE